MSSTLLTIDQPRFELNPQAQIEVRAVGRERHPLVVVDRAMASPRSLVEAGRRAEFSAPEHTRYPGLNAPLPAAYVQNLVQALMPLLQDVFGYPPDRAVDGGGFFALATAAPSELEPIQKVPHTDSADPFRIATVHYLFDAPLGGAGFFRHRATGFESVDASRRAPYVAAVSEELERIGDGLDRHVGPDTPTYELIDGVEPALDRLIIYRSHVLHSGLLDGVALSADPARGRLTANSFFEVSRRGTPSS